MYNSLLSLLLGGGMGIGKDKEGRREVGKDKGGKEGGGEGQGGEGGGWGWRMDGGRMF